MRGLFWTLITRSDTHLPGRVAAVVCNIVIVSGCHFGLGLGAVLQIAAVSVFHASVARHGQIGEAADHVVEVERQVHLIRIAALKLDGRAWFEREGGEGSGSVGWRGWCWGRNLFRHAMTHAHAPSSNERVFGYLNAGTMKSDSSAGPEKTSTSEGITDGLFTDAPGFSK